MGNAPTKRVKFSEDVRRDRFEESTIRYNHIMKVKDTCSREKLAHLVITFLQRCHGDVNVTNEALHEERVHEVSTLGMEMLPEHDSEAQIRAFVLCCVEVLL